MQTGLFILFLGLDKCEREVAFAAEFPVDFKGGFSEEEKSPSVCQSGCNLAKVSRADNVLEADIVYAAVECCASFELVLDKKGTALGHDFALYYPRYDGIAREMSPAEEFIFSDSVFCVCDTFRIYLDLIDQKHRLAMRQVFFKFFSVHFDCAFWYQVSVIDCKVRAVAGNYSTFLNATQPLCPPKPSESEIARVMSAFTALLGV